MKRYKLLKDLPFAKAGEEFSLNRGGIRDCITLYKNDEEVYQFKVGKNVPEMFDEWFKEVKEFEQYFIINMLKATVEELVVMCHEQGCIENMKSLGLLFETKQEAEEYLEYLKAKEVIKQDTKGFKPDWENTSQKRFFGYFNLIDKTLCHFDIGENMESKIFFGSREDIKESFKKHPDEWRTYLTYEQ